MSDDSPALIYETQLVAAIFEPLARILIERARPELGEHVLDAACGTGIVARLVAPTDFYGHMRVLTAEWFERPLEELPEHVSYGLPEWDVTPETYPSLHRWAVSGRNLFREVAMIPGARRVLRRMSNEGYHIRIITHRLFIAYFHAMAVQQTIEWLDHHGIPYSDLCFMKEKDQVGADIYVEDRPDAVQNLRNAGLSAICFANSTNVGIGPPRAANWDEVYTLVHQIRPPNDRPQPHIRELEVAGALSGLASRLDGGATGAPLRF